MNPEILYAVGSIGALFSLFGGFLLLWRRYQYCAGGCALNPRTRHVAWVLLLFGAALAAFAVLFAPPLPHFRP